MPRWPSSDLKNYQALQKKRIPARPWGRNALWAFLVGGAIALIGEAVRQLLLFLGVGPLLALNLTAAILVFLGGLLTGFGIYDEVGRVGGMGAALPITGFANAIVSPAMEFKREGWVMGVGARMFSIAGPVVVYGLLTSMAVGVVHYVLFYPR